MGNSVSVLAAAALLAAPAAEAFGFDSILQTVVTPAARCTGCRIERLRSGPSRQPAAAWAGPLPGNRERRTGRRWALSARSRALEPEADEPWASRWLEGPAVLSPMGTLVVRRTRRPAQPPIGEELPLREALAQPAALEAAAEAGAEAPAAAVGATPPAEAERRTRLSDHEAAYTHHVSLDVSLDRPVLPAPVSPVLLAASFLACVLAAVAVLARVPVVVGALGSAFGVPLRAVANLGAALRLPGLSGGLQYRCRLWLGSLQAWLDGVRGAWDRAFGPEEAPLPADDWSVCTLQERVKEGPAYLRYRFRLPQPNSVLPLGLAQEVTLCGLDAGDRVVAASFSPLSPRGAMGYFEILAKKEPGINSPEQQLVRLLDGLAIGDELAVRPGRAGLSYKGPYSPITDMVMVASGQGIVPMLQLVSELLPSRESSVSSAAVVWLNERADDFVLYPELEKCFYKYNRKLDVSCIIERDLFGHQLSSNPKVREAIPEFKIGTLAVVSGPDYFVRKVSEYLSRQGYPEEVIIPL